MNSQDAVSIVESIRRGECSAVETLERTLGRIAARDRSLNAFTALTAERALAQAAGIDARRKRGEALPPLAGVPYAVKNLFDAQGLATLAGSGLHRARAPARDDALLVQRMHCAGAILVGTLNMDAYAYGFTTENTAFGATRNPHDRTRIAGGSSGGSGAAVGAGLVPLSLGSDTNGSIRVPASLCGVSGLKPTFGRLPRTGSYPFVSSLDHLGPFARSARDLALCYDAVQGWDASDLGCACREPEPVLPTLEAGIDGLRIARLSGYFDRFALPEALRASRTAAAALGVREEIELPEVARARAAAFVITAAEGGARHLETLRNAYDAFEPHSRDRFLAGALTPATWYVHAQRFRSWFQARMAEVFMRYDVLVAPATPCSATVIGEEWLTLDGERFPLRPTLGLFTQPISFVGLPVAAMPIECGTALPIGVQLIAPPWREDLCLRAARALERAGVSRAREPQE